jgi:hypothetical protein
MSKKSMTAVKLRLILSLSIVLILGLTVFGFYSASKILHTYANDVATANGKAHLSESNVQRLQATKTDLEKNKEAVDRAANIVADSTSYKYQNQIITDISNYAQNANIKVLGFSFDTTSAAKPSTSTPGGAGAPIAGVKSTTVTVQLDSAVPYTNLLQFVHSIEQNLTKMQISKLSLAKASSGGANMVAGQSLAIEVYVK